MSAEPEQHSLSLKLPSVSNLFPTNLVPPTSFSSSSPPKEVQEQLSPKFYPQSSATASSPTTSNKLKSQVSGSDNYSKFPSFREVFGGEAETDYYAQPPSHQFQRPEYPSVPPQRSNSTSTPQKDYSNGGVPSFVPPLKPLPQKFTLSSHFFQSTSSTESSSVTEDSSTIIVPQATYARAAHPQFSEHYGSSFSYSTAVVQNDGQASILGKRQFAQPTFAAPFTPDYTEPSNFSKRRRTSLGYDASPPAELSPSKLQPPTAPPTFVTVAKPVAKRVTVTPISTVSSVPSSSPKTTSPRLANAGSGTPSLASPRQEKEAKPKPARVFAPVDICYNNESPAFCIQIVEGLIKPPKEKIPGGKDNRRPMAKQLLAIDYRKLLQHYPHLNETNFFTKFAVQATLYGFNRLSVQKEEVELAVMERIFLSDKKWIRVEGDLLYITFDSLVVTFSSHNYGQKLFIRFCLLDATKDHQYAALGHVDTSEFETITKRGIEKQIKTMKKVSKGKGEDASPTKSQAA